MFDKKIDPNKDPRKLTKKLNDSDINIFKEQLKSLKELDFPIKRKFDEIGSCLDLEELKSLKLCKLLYLIGYKKELFLHIGIIIESQLNSIVQTYIDNEWQTPSNFSNKASQEAHFERFKNKKTLDDKAKDIDGFNLFNDQGTSEHIKLKIQAFRFLRNYGGHSKSVNEFLESVIKTQTEDEIDDAFKLIKKIKIGMDTLIQNPPPKLPS